MAPEALQWIQVALLGGLVYMLMGPLHGWNGYRASKAQQALAAATTASAPASDHPNE